MLWQSTIGLSAKRIFYRACNSRHLPNMSLQLSMVKQQLIQMLVRLMDWQTIRFIITGSAGALLYFICSYVLISQFHWPVYLASLSAYATSFGFTYLGQKIWAFRSTAPHTRTVSRYAILQGGCAGFTALFSQLAADHTALSTFAISFIATFVAAGVSYFASSYWVFVDEPELNYASSDQRKAIVIGASAKALLLIAWLVIGGIYSKSYAYTPLIQDWHWLRDDQLFIVLAYLINQNHWQEPFCDLILSKGPGYSFVVAALQFTQLPLYLITGVFHYFSISGLSWILWRLSRSSWLCIGLWLILLGAPFYSSNNVLFREQLYPDQFMLGAALLLYALFVAKSQAGVFLSGLASSWVLGAFWQNYIAGLWISAGLSLLIIIALVHAWSSHHARTRIYQVIALVIFGCLCFELLFEFLRMR